MTNTNSFVHTFADIAIASISRSAATGIRAGKIDALGELVTVGSAGRALVDVCNQNRGTNDEEENETSDNSPTQLATLRVF